MSSREKLQELFNYCEQGVITRNDIMWKFPRMLDEAGSDSSALELCQNLPDWFRVELTKYIEKLRDADYFLMWTSSNETRSWSEMEADAKAHGKIMERLTPLILDVINSDH